MSVQAISWALSVQAGSPSAKCTLLCIANYADELGRCWPAQATLAKQSEQSTDTIQRRIIDLEKNGLLTRSERPLQNGRPGGLFFYQLLMNGSTQSPVIETMPQSAARSKSEPQNAANHAAKSKKPCRTVAALPTTKNPSVRKKEDIEIQQLVLSGGASPSGWPSDYREQFWQAYPRKLEKKAALTKLDTIRKAREVEWPKFIAAVLRYAAEQLARGEPQYTKHPTTWLNRGCWDDEPQGVQNGSGRPRTFQDDSRSLSVAGRELLDAAKRGEFSFPPRPSLLPTAGDHVVRLLPKGRGA
jgi:hypothetical protein